MPSPQQIERFTLAFHRVAMERLRRQPALRQQALEAIDRWESGAAALHPNSYRDTWRNLLAGEIETLEQAVCVDTDLAATLRSMSPLGFLLTEDERLRIRRKAMLLIPDISPEQNAACVVQGKEGSTTP